MGALSGPSARLQLKQERRSSAPPSPPTGDDQRSCPLQTAAALTHQYLQLLLSAGLGVSVVRERAGGYAALCFNSKTAMVEAPVPIFLVALEPPLPSLLRSPPLGAASGAWNARHIAGTPAGSCRLPPPTPNSPWCEKTANWQLLCVPAAAADAGTAGQKEIKRLWIRGAQAYSPSPPWVYYLPGR